MEAVKVKLAGSIATINAILPATMLIIPFQIHTHSQKARHMRNSTLPQPHQSS